VNTTHIHGKLAYLVPLLLFVLTACMAPLPETEAIDAREIMETVTARVESELAEKAEVQLARADALRERRGDTTANS